MIRQTIRLVMGMVCVMLLGSVTALGQVVFHESFDSGLTATEGLDYDWSGDWVATSGSVIFESSDGSKIDTSGGSVRVGAENSSFENTVTFNSDAFTGTRYLGFAVDMTGISSSNIYIGLREGDAGNSYQNSIAGIEVGNFGSNYASLRYGYNNSTGAIDVSSGLNSGINYFILRYDITAGGTSRVTVAVNPESNVSIGSDGTVTGASGAGTFTTTNVQSGNDVRGIMTHGYRGTGETGTRWDEVMLAESLSDVVSKFYLTISGNAGWRMLSFPVTGGSVEDIADNTAIQGVTGGDNADKASNFQTYDGDGAYQTPADNATAIGDGYGFITYFYDNTDAGSSELPLTLDVFGNEPSSDVNVTLNTSTQANGSYFTMVGNPFASNFDLSAVTVNGGSIQNNVQFWDDGSDTYMAQDRSTPFVAGTWQGFWVESSDGASDITFPTSGKTSSSATGTYFSKERPEAQIADVSFELSSERTLDKALRLSFRPEAELGWDIDDASKFIPLTENYATLGFVGDEKVQSVFSVPTTLEENVELALQESLVGVHGEFTLHWEGMDRIPEGLQLTLHDYQTGATINMQVQDAYTFEASASAEKRATPMSVLTGPVAELQRAKETDAPRLGITITANTSVSNEPGETPDAFALEQNYPNPFNPTTSIQYSVANAGEVQLTIYNVMGQRVETLVSGTKSAGTYRVSWDAGNMASGIYYYRLQAGNQVVTRQMTLIK